MIIYEIANSMADEETKVEVVRRDGYAVCHVWNGDIKTLKMDYPWCVVLWGKKVLETELRDGGYTIRLFIE